MKVYENCKVAFVEKSFVNDKNETIKFVEIVVNVDEKTAVHAKPAKSDKSLVSYLLSK